MLLQFRPSQMSPLFPYTTLFRSEGVSGRVGDLLLDQLEFAERLLELLPLARMRNGGLQTRFGRAGATGPEGGPAEVEDRQDRKSTRLNSSHANISYAVFCLKKK